MFKRLLPLPAQPRRSFFLWGPRQTGKTSLLRASYADCFWVDLLKADEYRLYIESPERLRQELEVAPPGIVVIDEVQKVPLLLDEVHWLIENRKRVFALSGSSARKVKRGHANLLGGRAVRHELFGLSAAEIGEGFDLNRLLTHGYLPNMYLDDRPLPLWSAYIGDYLKEEIAAEGLVRNLPAFSSFLNIAALSDGEQVNFSTIARECGVSVHTVQGYFGILEDTLLAKWLPSYKLRPKRRILGSPKFYFSDVGLVNTLLRRGALSPGTELFGKAFENWTFHELCTFNAYRERFAELFYWRLTTGAEVDFIINHMELAIEAKASKRIDSDHLKGLRALKEDHPRIKKRMVVCLESRARKTEDDIFIVPFREFVDQLWAGQLF